MLLAFSFFLARALISSMMEMCPGDSSEHVALRSRIRHEPYQPDPTGGGEGKEERRYFERLASSLFPPLFFLSLCF